MNRQTLVALTQKLRGFFLSTRLTGTLLLVFAVSVAAGTFIENDFGRRTAKALIYNTIWFEAIILLLATNLILNIFRFKLYRKEKLSQGLFHCSFIVIILGASITRYISYEGTMRIRENQSENSIITEATYLIFKTSSNGTNEVETKDEVLLSEWGKNSYSKTIDLDDHPLEISLKEYIPAASKEVKLNPTTGKPTLHLVMSMGRGRENIYMQLGEKLNMGDFIMAFDPNGSNINGSFLTFYLDKDNSLKISSPFELSAMSMLDQKVVNIKPGIHNLEQRTLYTLGNNNFVFKAFLPEAEIVWASIPKEKRDKDLSYMDGLSFDVTWKDETKNVIIFGQSGIIGKPKELRFDDAEIKLSYGSISMEVPLTIKLRDFVLERYPGSDSPSSFESHITLIDPEEGLYEDRKIFMNNVMDYKGFRFFQSSYDRDEKGTILSVNHDNWGTWITYLGYLMLASGMLLSLISPKGSLRGLAKKLEKAKNTRASMLKTLSLIFPLFLGSSLSAQSLTVPIVDRDHAENFSSVLIQDFKGRIKPINSLAHDVIRKVTKRDEFNGMDANQFFLGMLLFPRDFLHYPMIRVNSRDIVNQLGIKGKYASFVNFYDKQENRYLLSEQLEKAYHTKPAYRTKLDKEYIAVDERVNICFLLFNARVLRIFPDTAKNNKWMTPRELDLVSGGPHTGNWIKNSNKLSEFMLSYSTSVMEALNINSWKTPNELVNSLKKEQRKLAPEIIPSVNEVKAEIAYNRIDIFKHLMRYYLIVGLLITLLFFILMFLPQIKALQLVIKWMSSALMLGFLVHTFGLGLRWYISGHAPWSDGYESLIYIAWAGVLAGVAFSKKSIITTGFTGIFGGLALWVASISLFDPQITPLVPVLKSYWLTIHVSMITASYGFFGLGAITGICNMIVMILKSSKNKMRLDPIILELTYIAEMTLTVGIVMLTIGTFLGGIWANESWGRYWGWDPKEAWAFISILVYAFVLHTKFIPGLKGYFTFNILAVFAFFSILMTYFGVNFFLSGLHSYAAGDPIPIPSWVYFSVAALLLLSLVAFLKEKVNRNVLSSTS